MMTETSADCGVAQTCTSQFESLVRQVLGSNRCWNEQGLSERQIEMLLMALAAQDSNNPAPGKCFVGAGEREGRVYSKLVSDRWYSLAHGIGRSGNLCESQPKAKGSSTLLTISNELAHHALKVTLKHVKESIIVPMATGMSLLLCLLTLKSLRPDAKYVLWSRVDQKSSLKAIVTAGLEPVVVEMRLEGDELSTDMSAVQSQIKKLGVDNILCIMTTTSCFAPRGVDNIQSVAQLCHTHDIGHVVNNAYGLQSNVCTERIDQAAISGSSRLDFVVQSCDKNFMVPVGGAIIAGYSSELMAKIKNIYAGRASIGPSLDMFITLIQMGRNGYRELLSQQERCFKILSQKMKDLASKHGERILNTPSNKISIAMTLDSFVHVSSNSVTFIGSRLFTAGVTGSRVVDGKKTVSIGNTLFEQYGAHYNGYPHTYLNVACSIGMEEHEVSTMATKIDKILSELVK